MPRASVPAQLPSGTAMVAGIVVTPGDSPTPIRRAIVTVTSSDTGASRGTLTDDDGRFMVAALGAGRYTVTASKPAYLSTGWGARRPGRPGTTLVLTEAQQATDLTIAMPRGGVIAGRLTLANGDPMPDVEVAALPMRMARAGGTVSTPSAIRTDDQGHYRIYGLPPDEYLVAAYPQVGRGSIDVGGEQGPPRLVGYAPTYFPGTALVVQAIPVTVGFGDERLGVDMVVRPEPTATLRGVVTGVDGAPQQASQVSVEAIGPPAPFAFALALSASRPDAQGRFEVHNVPPGTYRVSARAGGVTYSGTSMSVQAAQNTQWAMVEVSVSGDNVEGVMLSLREGAVFSGRLVAAEGTPEDDLPASWANARVAIQPVRPPGQTRTASLGGGTRSAVIDQDGVFAVNGLSPGTYEVALTLPAALAGWHLESIRHGGRDVRDAPLTFETGSLDGVDIVLSRTPSSLSGRFSTEHGAPVSDYFLVLFPDDQGLWHDASPRLRVVRPAADGRFTITGLPAGAYRLAAVVDLDEDEHRLSAFLASVYDGAVPVTIASGAETRQDLRINR